MVDKLMNGSGIKVGNVNGDNIVIGNGNSFYNSADYKLLKKDQARLIDLVSIPDFKNKYGIELDEINKRINDFEKNVIELANFLEKIEINTERFKQAKEFFEKGDYESARDSLNVESLFDEQRKLVEKNNSLDIKKKEIEKELSNNANEFIFLAKLTTLNYDLKDKRIAEASKHFESALQVGRTPSRLIEYAKFLQDNNLFSDAESLYAELIAIYDNRAEVYRPYLADALNNKGVIYASCVGQQEKARNFYMEALNELEKSPDKNIHYLSKKAEIEHNLGEVLVALDNDEDAKSYYISSLSASTFLVDFAFNHPAIKYFKKTKAGTLNNLGILLKLKSSDWPEAERFYLEASVIFKDLLSNDSNDHEYLSSLAMVLGNIGNGKADAGCSVDDVRYFYDESLAIYRQLTSLNPERYTEMLAKALNNLALFFSEKGFYDDSDLLYKEAVKLYDSFPMEYEKVILVDMAAMLKNFTLNLFDKDASLQESDEIFEKTLLAHEKLYNLNKIKYADDFISVLALIGESYYHGLAFDKAKLYLKRASALLKNRKNNSRNLELLTGIEFILKLIK